MAVTRLSANARNAAANAVVDLVDAGPSAGTLKIYSGAQPATADTAETGTLLATIPWADPAFGNAATGVATATDPVAVVAAATGTAGYFRIEDSTGANVWDGDVTATGGGGALELQTTSLVVGVSVDITGFTYTQPAG